MINQEELIKFVSRRRMRLRKGDIMSFNWLRFGFQIIWLLGLFLLVVAFHHYEQAVKEIVGTTFNLAPQLWFTSSVPFLFGIYLSLLFVKKWFFKVNLQLLLSICVPCLILSFYSPIVYSFFTMTATSTTFSIPIPYWMIIINNFGIVSFVAGFTLVNAIFGSKSLN